MKDLTKSTGEQVIDRIPSFVFDDEGNSYPCLIEIEIDSMGDCEVLSVTTSANVPLNNPEIEIKDAIKGRYPKSTVTFKTL